MRTGIKPIIGCEFYLHNDILSDKTAANNPLYHLVLLAKNKEGYKNLVKLVSIAQVEGFYYKPRINNEYIEKYKEGLICLSGCVGGEVCKHLLQGNYDKAFETAKYYKDLFGEDYYIEIQDHGLEKQKITNPDLIKIAKEQGLKFTFGSDSRNQNAGRLSYCKRIAEECNLTKEDFYLPKRKN